MNGRQAIRRRIGGGISAIGAAGLGIVTFCTLLGMRDVAELLFPPAAAIQANVRLALFVSAAFAVLGAVLMYHAVRSSVARRHDTTPPA